jgi:N utilization substance protein B
MQGPRRQGRAFALQLLYQSEMHRVQEPDDFERFWGSHQASKKARTLAESLVRDTLANLPEIDAKLTAELEQWKLSRLPVVVRNLLRMAVCEMVMQRDVPFQVVIDEAVELARDFVDEESSRFVNSVLEKCRLAAGMAGKQADTSR